VTDRTTGNKILGKIAQQVMPWTSAKATAVTSAQTYCANFATTATNAKFAALMLSLSRMLDCSLRIAKTDLYVGTSNADTSCTTPGNANGVLTATDVDPSGTGSGVNAMCAADITACSTQIAAISLTQLNASGLDSISGNITTIQTALGLAGTTDIARTALAGTIP